MSALVGHAELPGRRRGFAAGRLLAAGAVGAIGLLFMADSVYVVQPTELAAVRRLGVVRTATPVGPGLHLKAPLIDTVDRLAVSLGTLQMPDTAVYTVDNQTVHVGISLSYRVPASAVLHLLYGVGRPGDIDIEENIRPVIADRSLRVFARHNTLNISAEREQIAGEVRREVAEALGAMFGIEVVDLQIASIGYSAGFTDSVEAAVRSKNDAMAAANQVARIRYEGEQRKVQAEAEAVAQVTAAEADSRATVLRAQAEAQALILRGEAEARVTAQRAAAVGSNPNLVAYTYAQRWNGQLPVTVLGSQVTPLPLLDLARQMLSPR